MRKNDETKRNDNKIALITIITFLKISYVNIVISIFLCILGGTAYFLFAPKIYEAKIIVELAAVAGEPIETPEALLEKIKMKQYFSRTTLEECSEDIENDLENNFIEKIKPSLNILTKNITLENQSKSLQQSKKCLIKVVAEISNKQDEQAIYLIKSKKHKLKQLKEQLEQIKKNKEKIELNKLKNLIDEHPKYILYYIYQKYEAEKTYELELQISKIEQELSIQYTHPLLIINSIYSTDQPINKYYLNTFNLSVLSGLAFGVLISIINKEKYK